MMVWTLPDCNARQRGPDGFAPGGDVVIAIHCVKAKRSEVSAGSSSTDQPRIWARAGGVSWKATIQPVTTRSPNGTDTHPRPRQPATQLVERTSAGRDRQAGDIDKVGALRMLQ
jgi:hypothetical protein